MIANSVRGDTERQSLTDWLPPSLLMLLAAAFAARVAVRVAFGQDYFWSNSYFDYYKLAENIAGGKGFCLPQGS